MTADGGAVKMPPRPGVSVTSRLAVAVSLIVTVREPVPPTARFSGDGVSMIEGRAVTVKVAQSNAEPTVPLLTTRHTWYSPARSGTKLVVWSVGAPIDAALPTGRDPKLHK